MNDKDIMEGILLLVKGAADLYLHGTIESNTQNVHTTFDSALCDVLKMQNEIYTKMSNKGWYPTEKVEQQKIDKVSQKFSAQ